MINPTLGRVSDEWSDNAEDERERVARLLTSEKVPETFKIYRLWHDNIAELSSVFVDPLGRLWRIERDPNSYQLSMTRVRLRND